MQSDNNGHGETLPHQVLSITILIIVIVIIIIIFILITTHLEEFNLRVCKWEISSTCVRNLYASIVHTVHFNLSAVYVWRQKAGFRTR
jgi:hypothetical protein